MHIEDKLADLGASVRERHEELVRILGDETARMQEWFDSGPMPTIAQSQDLSETCARDLVHLSRRTDQLEAHLHNGVPSFDTIDSLRQDVASQRDQFVDLEVHYKDFTRTILKSLDRHRGDINRLRGLP